jgi:exonuclease V gamma subunit
LSDATASGSAASDASAPDAASPASASEASASNASEPEATALHTWRWALDRLLLGYAAADPAGSWPRLWEGLEPVPGVGGLGAAQLGSLDTLLERLLAWWSLSQQALTPPQWAEQARQLVADLFLPQGERERDALAALDDALARWLGQCAAAGFDEPVPMGVLRDAWLSQLQSPGLTQRFKAGGVTFCTLLPMRAVPFEMVCLLGMNDGEYPRSSSPSTLDLMQQPGLARHGHRRSLEVHGGAAGLCRGRPCCTRSRRSADAASPVGDYTPAYAPVAAGTVRDC